MSRFFVHIATGAENTTRATLGFLVARSAVEEGHEVTMFLAGDAVQLVRDATIDNVEGLGTGRLRAHYEALKAAGVSFHLSAKSCAARGIEPDSLRDHPVELAMPNTLVRLAAEADTVLTY